MRFGLIIIFLYSSFLLKAQTISGIVTEKGSNKPLPFANVFINNSTLGAATDEEGRFSISGNLPEEFELVASFVGFETRSVEIKRKGRQSIVQNFELLFLEDQLSEVELKAKRDKSWERNLKRFKEVFLAVPDDPFGRDIEILNPWVIDFETVKPEKGFNYTKASARQPLQLENRALGYRIDFYLQDFRMLRNASRFFGQAFYQELPSENALTDSIWMREKELNYRNSVRHLVMSILLKNSGAQGFELYTANPKIPKEDRTNDFYYELNKSIVPVKLEFVYVKPLGNGTYRIFLPERVEVHHLTKPWPNDYYTNIYHAISWIVAPSGHFDVDQKGTLLHPTQLVLSGFMGRQRMARSLPLDFIPNVNFSGFLDDFQVFQNRHIMLNNLREKPWLSTNKAFYYPGETLWVGGKMLYQNEIKQDTLSRVLHWDLMDERLNTVQYGSFPIQNGRISGGLLLSDTLSKGNYLLRAYTRWSMNFGEMDYFRLPFPILDIHEMLEANVVEEEEGLFGDIQVAARYSLSDSLNYRVLSLELDFLDEFENQVESEVQLTATVGSLQMEVEPQYRLEKAMEWLDNPLKESFDTDLPYPIEYGVSVLGKFFPNKRRDPLAVPITLVKGDLEDYGQVYSDSSGVFWASGFQFEDSAQIAIAALDQKLRPFGRVELVPWVRPGFRGSFSKASYQVVLLPKAQEPLMDFFGDYILLEEFVKESDKEKESQAERNYGYGDPNQEIGPKDLETKTWAEILGLLRFNINTLKFRNYTFGEVTGSPLLIIDGNSMPFLDPLEFRERLLSFEPSQLKSVKAYNDNISNVVFGMAGYSGVLMIETKNGSRIGPDSYKKFNSEGFQIFPVAGFTSFPAFSNTPPKDQYLKPKATLYWNPMIKVENGQFQTLIYVPYGTDQIQLRVEGTSSEGQPIYRLIPLKLDR
ncbi:carboxypeptidase-like regulatory domain-containing protein [Algoriphagus confluentis]|uniref:Carboxypeptidase-like regulatory domain-containing protein n=1 Tax=Algoriphagus confluentis TaxID=1697556 RepID=A0ABQ6PMI8_9BACT|nr:hypothetical protein Aconfl_10530 [Algoriphagus confluentis]